MIRINTGRNFFKSNKVHFATNKPYNINVVFFLGTTDRFPLWSHDLPCNSAGRQWNRICSFHPLICNKPDTIFFSQYYSTKRHQSKVYGQTNTHHLNRRDIHLDDHIPMNILCTMRVTVLQHFRKFIIHSFYNCQHTTSYSKRWVLYKEFAHCCPSVECSKNIVLLSYWR